MRVLGWPAYENRRINPHQWLLNTALTGLSVQVDEFSVRRLASGSYDLWHIHWPERFLIAKSVFPAARGSLGLVALVGLARARGVVTVWTIHNLAAHERRHETIERHFWPAFIRRLDAFISLTPQGHAAALARFPGLRMKRSFVIPRGHYRGTYPDTIDRVEARRQLGFSSHEKVALSIGQIRPYKNAPRLIREFGRLIDANARLVVAGKPLTAQDGALVREAAAGDRRVRLVLEFISDDVIQVFLRAADLVVLPYVEILNSGAALLALSFDRPVLAPAMGSVVFLRERVGEAWVRGYDGDLDSAELGAALQWAVDATRPAFAPLDSLSWEDAARTTEAAFRSLLATRPGG